MQRIQISGKRLSKLQRKLRAMNLKFNKLSRKEQRIAIAKDVVEMLRAKKIVANSTYLTMPTETMFDEHTPGFEKAAERGLDASVCLEQVKCEVCGIGSLFVGALRHNDKLSAGTLKEQMEHGDIRQTQVEYLEKWFDADQLQLVEDYYEQNSGDFESPIYMEDDDNKRLSMIMENIISNGGKFDPSRGQHRITAEQ